jgi:hypothetical protein
MKKLLLILVTLTSFMTHAMESVPPSFHNYGEISISSGNAGQVKPLKTSKKQTVCATQKRSMSIARISTSYSTEYHINFIQPSKNPMSLIYNNKKNKYYHLCIDAIENLDQQILKLLFEIYERMFKLASTTAHTTK